MNIESKDPWAHRSANMRCQTCMWWVPKIGAAMHADTPRLGRCRRKAPSMHGFPVVFFDDWCGQHRLDETKVK